MTKMKKIISLALVVSSFLLFRIVHAVFYPVQVQSFTICPSGSAIGDTTLCIQSFKDIGGTNLTMTAFGAMGYGTIDPNNGSQEESITFTGVTQNSNGTASLTGVNSVTLYQPFVLTGNITKNHAGAATFVISNTSYFYNQIYLNATDPTSPQNIATKNYVDGKAFGGIGGASESATGTVQIATNLQAASSTSSGTVGRLALPSSISTSTYNASGALQVVVTQNNNKIDSNFISSSTLFATSSFSGTPIASIGKNIIIATTTQVFSVPSGVTYFDVQCIGGGGGGAQSVGNGGAAGGGAGAYIRSIVNVTATSSFTITIGAGGLANGGTGGDSSFGVFLSAKGAVGNAGGVASTTITNNVISLAGSAGGGGAQITGLAISGLGASSFFGNGAMAVYITSGSQIGNSSTVWGTGGSGASVLDGSTKNGGAGAAGVCIVMW